LVPSGLTSNNYQIQPQAGDYMIAQANQLVVKFGLINTPYGTAQSYAGATAAYSTANGVVLPNLPITIAGSTVTVNDGAGTTAQFNLAPNSAIMSTSGNLNVGNYSISNQSSNGIGVINQTITGNNFANGLVVLGAVNVTPKILSFTDLGITGVAKVYDGSVNMANLTLGTSAGAFVSGDHVQALATGTFSTQNVGTGLGYTVGITFSGADATNYSITGGAVYVAGTGGNGPANGSITQLASVTYTGSAGSNWSNPANWTTTGTTATGAVPTLSNVANVIIPVNNSVVYDSAVAGPVTSAVTDNGNLTFNLPSATTIAMPISGTGNVTIVGAGTITLTGNNTYSGSSILNTGTTLIAGSNTAVSAGNIISSNGSFGSSSGVLLPSLNVTGQINLISSITTSGSQSYSSALTTHYDLGASTISVAGNATLGGAVTTTGAQTYGGTLNATGAITADSLSVAGNAATNAAVTTVGAQTYGANLTSSSTLSASGISVAGNATLGGAVTTTGAQTYGGTLNASGAITAGSLSIAGDATLGGAVTTAGDQLFRGSLTLANGLAGVQWGQAHGIQYTGTIPEASLVSNNGNIYLIGNIDANVGTGISLAISAAKEVTLGGSIGSQSRLWNLTVSANRINILADILTGGTQTYNGAVYIGDASYIGGTPTTGFLFTPSYTPYFNYVSGELTSTIDYLNMNPVNVRTLISQDPIITFNGSVNDVNPNTHTLLTAAISAAGGSPSVNFNAPVGTIAPLYSLNAQTYIASSLGGSIASEGTNTFSSQTYGSSGVLTTAPVGSGAVTFSVFDPLASVTFIVPVQANTTQLNVQNLTGIGTQLLINGSSNYTQTNANTTALNNWGSTGLTSGQALGYIAPPNTPTVQGTRASSLTDHLPMQTMMENIVDFMAPVEPMAPGSVAVSVPEQGLIVAPNETTPIPGRVLDLNPTNNSDTRPLSVNDVPPPADGNSAVSGRQIYIQVQTPEGTEVVARAPVANGDGLAFRVPPSVVDSIRNGGPDLNLGADTTILVATQADGSPLPSWVKFDPETQTFTSSKVPDGVKSVTIKLQARQGQKVLGSSILTIEASSAKK